MGSFSQQAFRQDATPNGEQDRYGSRGTVIPANAFTGGEQGFMVPILIGRAAVTGNHMVPTWNFEAIEETSSAGK
jgi:hypothetical protein